jgi:hypothetical protein
MLLKFHLFRPDKNKVIPYSCFNSSLKIDFIKIGSITKDFSATKYHAIGSTIACFLNIDTSSYIHIIGCCIYQTEPNYITRNNRLTVTSQNIGHYVKSFKLCW